MTQQTRKERAPTTAPPPVVQHVQARRLEVGDAVLVRGEPRTIGHLTVGRKWVTATDAAGHRIFRVDAATKVSRTARAEPGSAPAGDVQHVKPEGLAEAIRTAVAGTDARVLLLVVDRQAA